MHGWPSGVAEALKELKMHEGDISFLEEEYQHTLANADMIVAELKHSPMRVERLHDTIVQVRSIHTPDCTCTLLTIDPNFTAGFDLIVRPTR